LTEHIIDLKELLFEQ